MDFASHAQAQCTLLESSVECHPRHVNNLWTGVNLQSRETKTSKQENITQNKINFIESTLLGDF